MSNNSTFRYLLLFCWLLCLGVIAACERQAESEDRGVASAETPVMQGTIVALGDSLTAGLGVGEERAYPAVLERRLHDAGLNYRVINSGVSGETTSGTLSRLDWVMTLAPDIVILEVGANDGLRGIDPAVPAANLERIVQYFKQRDVVVVLCGMKMVWNLGPEYTREFNAIYPHLAEREGLIFMDFFLEDVAMVKELNIEDGLHPNEKGYVNVVENLLPYVKKAIRQFEERKD